MNSADVRIVHADARLDEQHALHESEAADCERDRAPLEQDPRQDVEAGGHQHTRDHARQAPRERMRADVDGRGRPAGIEHEQLLPVVRHVFGLRVHRQGHRLEPHGQHRIGVDRVRVRLDDVHRPAIRSVPVDAVIDRRPAEDVDLLAGGVVGNE